MSRTRSFVLLMVIGFSATFPASAQDGLYAPSRPEDAALVRVVNVSPDSPSPVIDAGPIRFGERDPFTSGPYRPLPVGVYLLGDPDDTVFTPEARSFVTIVAGYDRGDPRKLILFEDEPHDDPARAQLVLYNLAEVAVSLLVADGEVPVFPDVPPAESRAVAVNAVSVDLEVRDAHGASQTVSVSLSRGASFSLFAIGSRSSLEILAVDATVDSE